MKSLLATLAALVAPAALHAQAGTPDQIRILLDGMRGANAVQCELALQGMQGWWSNGPEPGRDAVALNVIRHAAYRNIDAGNVTMLAAALKDNDSCVRRVAARLLGRSRLPAARSRLLEATRDADPVTRQLGALGLGHMDDRTLTRDLVKMLDDRDAGVRAAAAWAIGAVH